MLGIYLQQQRLVAMPQAVEEEGRDVIIPIHLIGSMTLSPLHL